MSDPRREGTAGLALACLALAALWSLGLGLAHRGGAPALLERLEAPLADLRFHLAGSRASPPEVVVVAIDDATVAASGRYPMPRADLARLVAAIGTAGASVAAIDLLLLDAVDPAADAALAGAMRAMPTVLAVAAVFASDAEPDGEMPRAARMLLPAPVFRSGIVLGPVNLGTDAGGVPRHVPAAIAGPGGPAASFVVRAAGLAAKRDPRISAGAITLGEGRPPSRLDLGYALPLRYYGPRGTIPTISAASLLGGEVPRERIAGRIAVVGATAIGAGDTFATPFDPVMPGVEVLATGIAHLVAGDGLVRDSTTRLVDAGAALALALAAVLVVLRFAPGPGAILIAGLALLWLAIAAAAFARGIWLSAAMPIAAMLPPALAAWLARQGRERRRAGHIAEREAALRSFQPPRLAAALEADPDFLAEPVAGVAAILFLDLTGFTGLSERLGPAATRDFLRGFHGEVEEIVGAHGGVVISYMGDGAMVVFGLPEPQGDDAARAVAAAFALHRGVTEWMAKAAPAPLAVRVGGHRGPVVFSRLGAATHQQITATGDSVNVAARLLEVASRERAALVLGAELIAAAAPPVPPAAEHEIAIRGREKPLRIALWRAQDLD